MPVFNRPLDIRRGVLHLNGQPRLLVSADYPYYRDHASNWSDRLRLLRSLGIEVVTAYIPWRHHQPLPDSAPDFSGATQPNRDVLGFLRLCQAHGLAAIVKPGPFIHAETNYGGLPDWVSPVLNEEIEATLAANGAPVTWAGARLAAGGKTIETWPLPAPLSAVFLAHTAHWLAAVSAQVIRPNISPAGAIVALQIANEGIYSNGQHAPWAFDYSDSSLVHYRQFLEETYGSLERYNQLHASRFARWDDIPAPHSWNEPLNLADLRTYLDWGQYQPHYYQRVLHAWTQHLPAELPVFLNQNPPLGEPFGLDAWLTRVEPEVWQGVHYGTTNWVGDVSANPSAFERYLLTSKRYPGVNMEENWGFAELYDPAYVDAAVCLYQTLVALNAGATGFNVYTGVATAFPDRNLEVLPKAPYPDAAPITELGQLTPKAEIVRWLTLFLEHYGAEFLAAHPAQAAAWGLYLPYAHAGAWAPSGAHNGMAPALGVHLAQFQSQLRSLNLDYGVLNLAAVSLADLLHYPRLFTTGRTFMAETIQHKLAEYVRQGGQLTVIGELPAVDENGQPCTLLQDVRASVCLEQQVSVSASLAQLPAPRLLAGQADVWVRSHPTQDVHFVTVLIPAQGSPDVLIDLPVGSRQHRLELHAVPSGGAILRLENGRLSAAIVKGHNGYLNISGAPHGSLDGLTFGSHLPGDFALINGWSWHLPAA